MSSKPTLPRDTLREYSDPKYQKPSKEHLRELLRSLSLTGKAAAAIVGVNARTIRRWTGGERPTPYASWRLLLIYGGLVEPPQQTDDTAKSKRK